MRPSGLFAFEVEEIGETLELVPLAARRALDRAGLHLSLEGWRTLSQEARRDIVAEGVRVVVDVATVARRVGESAVTASPIEAREELAAEGPPADVVALLGPDAARVERAWARLDPLARFALAHVTRKSAKRGEPARLAAALAAIVPDAVPPASSQAQPGRVRDHALSADEAIAAVSHAGAGGVSVFLGVVRDTNEGRAITLLEYEAYRSMAEAELGRIEREIESAIPGARVFASHRLGALRVGDIAVVCAASAPHRGEAFTACRRLIDEIKSRLPIWKREHGPDGPYWVGWEDARCGTGDHDHAHAHSR